MRGIFANGSYLILDGCERFLMVSSSSGDGSSERGAGGGASVKYGCASAYNNKKKGEWCRKK